MTEKRFRIDNESDIIEFDYNSNEYIQDFMWADGKSWDKICNRLNELYEENEKLKSLLECSREEANDYCEELMGKDEFIKLYKKENEQLREALKNSYINEICENCKYGHYFLDDNYDYGFEGNFECKKRHFGNEDWKCCDLTECDDFELRLKGDDGK